MPFTESEQLSLLRLVGAYAGHVGLTEIEVEIITLKLTYEPDDPRQLIYVLHKRYPEWSHKVLAQKTGYCRETVSRWIRELRT